MSRAQALAYVDSMNALNPQLTYELVHKDVKWQRTFLFHVDYGNERKRGNPVIVGGESVLCK
jgi:hypothetical protein